MKLLAFHTSLILFLFHYLEPNTRSQTFNKTNRQDSITHIGSINFPSYKSRLSKQIKSELNRFATIIRNNPESRIAITGYCGATENQRLNKANWDRVNAIIKYFTEKKNLNEDRFIFRYGAEGGECNSVEISFTNETVNFTPPPRN